MLAVPLPSEPKPAHRILVVDDDSTTREVARLPLELAGYEVWQAASGPAALKLLAARGLPDLALVDIVMPEMDGIELCRRIHELSDLPVIMLTLVDDEETIIHSLDTIAEDYVTKPFQPRELVARVRRVLRRVGDFATEAAARVRVDARLEVDFARQQAYIEGRPVELTPRETKLFYVVMHAAGRTVTTHDLLERLWPQGEGSEEALRNHAWRLRKKIEASPRRPRYLITRRGIGYRFGDQRSREDRAS